MGGSERGVKALGFGADANFFPSRLEKGQALLHEALGPGAATCSFLLNFSDWSIGISFRVSRHAARWAGLGNSVNCVELWKRTISNSGSKRDGKKHICKERSNIFFLVRLREAQRCREQSNSCKIFVSYLCHNCMIVVETEVN